MPASACTTNGRQRVVFSPVAGTPAWSRPASIRACAAITAFPLDPGSCSSRISVPGGSVCAAWNIAASTLAAEARSRITSAT